MTDDLKRYAPQAKLVPKTRGSGDRYIGVMSEHPTGQWVRLDDVGLLRMQAEHLRQELAIARGKLAVYDGGWTERMCRVFVRAHDREESAQIGECDPWATSEANDDIAWQHGRVACVRAGLDALIRWRANGCQDD